jgi:sugar phosphate permease
MVPPIAIETLLATPDDPRFKARRAQNWVFLGLMYAMFYMGRYNFAAVNALLANKYGWTNSDLGAIISAGKITYGVSVFLNGPLADKIGGKKAILIGAVGSALFNLVFGFGYLFLGQDAVMAAGKVVTPATFNAGMTHANVIGFFAIAWALNHYFQSFGALSIVKINAAWFKVEERGSFAGIFGIMIQSGRMLAFAVGPLITGALPWQWVFWIPALSLGILFVLNSKLVENTPADAGIGELNTGDETAEEKASAGGLAFVLKKVFASKTMWTIALASMMIGFVRNGVDDWFPKYFSNVHKASAVQKAAMIPYNLGALALAVLIILSILKLKGRIDQRTDWSRERRFTTAFSVVGFVFLAAGLVMAWLLRSMPDERVPTVCFVFASVGMPIAAVFGGLVSGNLSDVVFDSRRAPVIFLAFVGMAATAIIFSVVPGGPFFAAWMMISISFFIQSAHSLVGGAASMDFGGRKAVATAAGLFDGAQYVAGAIVALMLGKVLDQFGWNAWGYTLFPFAIVGALLIGTLWNAKPGRAGH